MKRFVLYLGIALLAFAVGAIAATLWKSHSSRSHTPVLTQGVEEECPLTKQIVSRSLQSHSFRTDKLRRNSNDEIVWRWLQESIATYPQNSVKLNLPDTKTSVLVLYPLKAFETTQLRNATKP